MSFIDKEDITGLSGLKIAEKYSYRSSAKTVIVNEDDLNTVVSIFNSTLNRQIYTVGSQSMTGMAEGKCIFYDLDLSGAEDSNELYILYKPKNQISDSNTLLNIEKLLKNINKTLIKINNP